MKSILSDVGEVIWGTDSRLVRTLRDYINPGVYTRNWLDKKQARYISPVRMFLIINVVYFLLLSFLSHHGLAFDTFVTSFENQIYDQFYSEQIRDSSLGLITSNGFEKDHFAQLYNSRVFAVSNSLIIIFSLLLAFSLYLVNFRKSRLVYHHITMGLYYGGYLLMTLMAVNLILGSVILLLHSYLNLSFLSILLEVGITLLYIAFAFIAQVRMYKEHKFVSFLKSLVIAILITLAGVILYRFILFWITLATVLLFP